MKTQGDSRGGEESDLASALQHQASRQYFLSNIFTYLSLFEPTFITVFYLNLPSLGMVFERFSTNLTIFWSTIDIYPFIGNVLDFMSPFLIL